MKAYKNKKAFTIVEILIVIVVVATLTSMIITVATRLNTQTKIKLTQASLVVIDAAIEQFRDYEYNYYGRFVDYDFPLDCNTLEESDIAEALGTPASNVEFSTGSRNWWCFFLTRVPQCRGTLDRIADEFRQIRTIKIDNRIHSFVIITDSWQKPLRYQYQYNYVDGQNFPLISSAGPDRQFGTRDDITNEQ